MGTESYQASKIVHLDKLHEEVHILGVELLAEVVHGLVHVIRQRVLLAAADEVALAPDFLHVLPGRRRRRHRRRRRRYLHGCWISMGSGEEETVVVLEVRSGGGGGFWGSSLPLKSWVCLLGIHCVCRDAALFSHSYLLMMDLGKERFSAALHSKCMRMGFVRHAPCGKSRSPYILSWGNVKPPF